MASNINTTDIDATYPVAGQDNDSQGFRDNFSTIKDNFVAAKAEIVDLQTNTAKLNADNDFGGTTISNAVFISTTEEVYNAGNVTAGQNISFSNGSYQTITVANSFTLTLADWPANLSLGKIRVVIRGNDSNTRTITWSTEAAGTIKYSSNWPTPFTLTSATAPKIVDFWTDDGGVTVYAQFIDTFGT